jgi:hypothetical protein
MGWDGRKHQKGMVVVHLAAGLGVVVEPDQLTAFQQPGRQPQGRIHGITSAPVGSQAMASVSSSAMGG